MCEGDATKDDATEVAEGEEESTPVETGNSINEDVVTKPRVCKGMGPGQEEKGRVTVGVCCNQ